MMTQDCAAILVPLTACREPVALSVSCVTVMTRKMQTEPARAKYVILCCNRHAEGIYWRLLVGFSQQASIAQVRQKLQQVSQVRHSVNPGYLKHITTGLRRRAMALLLAALVRSKFSLTCATDSAAKCWR